MRSKVAKEPRTRAWRPLFALWTALLTNTTRDIWMMSRAPQAHHLQLLLVAAAAAGAATGVVWGSCRSSARVAGALGLCGMLPGGPVAHPKLAVHARLDTRKVGLRDANRIREQHFQELRALRNSVYVFSRDRFQSGYCRGPTLANVGTQPFTSAVLR